MENCKFEDFTLFFKLQVGLIPDEKLVNMLGLALSADTKRTIRSTREIIESGIEPLVLITQLASLITNNLAGSYIQSTWSDENIYFIL